ncbi:MAG: LamG domain-containing protein [Bacteroidales bacterium]|nr:LamG domain-containing protein [Bacteroidales bacterium]MDD3665685.1 LamG domain-containing protein [Bacteroidales bacterium]
MKHFFTLLIFLCLATLGFGQQGGYALEFDGTNDYVAFGYNSNLILTSSVSIEAWIKLNSTNTQDFLAGKIIHGGSNYGYGLYINAGNLGGSPGQITFIAGRSWNDWPSVRSNTILETGKWYHVVGTFDGRYLRIYVNGMLDNTYDRGYSYSMNDSGDNFKIGYNSNIGDNYFDGYIDEVRVWGTARTQEEIKANMCKEVGTNTNLKAYYQMSNGSGTTLTDNSGNSGTGTISGASWVSSTAPLPYYTVNDGSWATNATWASGQNVPANDWASVDINNAVTMGTGVGKTVNDLTVGAGATLTVESGGSLITNGTITNNGTINVKREMADGRWHLVSAPVVGATAEPFTGKYLQSWSEPTHSYSQITLTNTPLAPTTGYLLWGNLPGKASHTTYTITGTPLTGNQSKSLTYTDNGSGNKGANLVGNPYPSSIDWDLLRGTYGAVYYLDNGSYVSWNNGGSGSRYIPPMQGFFVVTGANGTLSLTNAHRTHTGATSFYKQSTASDMVVLETVSPDGYSDKLYLRFDQEAQPGFELPRDAWKLPSFADGVSQLWSVDPDGGRLSIDVRPATETIPVGFSNTANGTYSIGIALWGNQPALYLEDTQTGTIHNFANGDYHFNYTLTDNPNRFKLLFGAIGTPETTKAPIRQWIAGNTLYISAPELTGQQAMVTVYSLTGQALQRHRIAFAEITSLELQNTPGTVLVETKSVDGSRVLTTKGIIIK